MAHLNTPVSFGTIRQLETEQHNILKILDQYKTQYLSCFSCDNPQKKQIL